MLAFEFDGKGGGGEQQFDVQTRGEQNLAVRAGPKDAIRFGVRAQEWSAGAQLGKILQTEFRRLQSMQYWSHRGRGEQVSYNDFGV